MSQCLEHRFVEKALEIELKVEHFVFEIQLIVQLILDLEHTLVQLRVYYLV